MTFDVSVTALADIELILEQTGAAFGLRQIEIYAKLIGASFALIAENPLRPSSTNRPELGDGIRALRVDVAATRRGAAAHVVFYALTAQGSGSHRCTVLRVLHEAMDPQGWLEGSSYDPDVDRV